MAETFHYRRDAFFLEFGAFDGVTASNTLMLEQTLGWSGIVVEANPTYYPSVCKHRQCVTVNAALWPTSRESVDMIDAHGLTSMEQYQNVDHLGDVRESIAKRRFSIDTVNPTELLARYRVADRIEYLSLDVEGCEMDVLQAIDFSYYQIALMTVEHSQVPERQAAVRDFLLPLGYVALERFYDDWFFHPGHLAQLQLPGEVFDPVAAFGVVEKLYTISE